MYCINNTINTQIQKLLMIQGKKSEDIIKQTFLRRRKKKQK